MKEKKVNENKEQKSRLTENIKLVFLVVISVGIIAGSYILFWQIQKQNAPQQTSDQNEVLRSEIEDLNGKIEALNKSLGESRSESETKVTTTQVISSGTGKVAGASDSSGGTEVSGKVNLNTASASELDSLPGIGPAYAQRIIDYRDSNGGFSVIEDVQNVKGIGPKTFEKMKDLITI